MKNYSWLTVFLLFLVGCGESRFAEVNITNTLIPNVVSVKTQEVGDTSARNEKLTKQLSTGDTICFNVPAPTKSKDANGVRCTIVVEVSEQWTTLAPGEEIDRYVDENGETTLEMTRAQYQEGKERAKLKYTASRTAQFESLHAGDVVNWDFDGKYVNLVVE